ncbi:uncharacterized protein PgNI_01600, partial [Pyricularia grisea]|uniref:Uncharacterized protein n=1 Tax=Pyricularia grisea TaxID=148305 RepID=A0A6P8BGT7_PYRGI
VCFGFALLVAPPQRSYLNRSHARSHHDLTNILASLRICILASTPFGGLVNWFPRL